MTPLAKNGAVLVALTLLTAACGGSSKAKEVTPTTATGTKAATAINLKAADLPSDWKSTPADNSNNSADSTDKKIATCLGLASSDTKDVVDVNSDSFAKGAPPQGTQVNSEVEVVATLAQATRLRKAFSGDKAQGCLKTVYSEEAKTQAGSTPGLTIGAPTVTQKSGPSGTDGGFQFDILIPVTSQGVTLKVNASIIGFFVKHTEVTLQTTTIGTAATDYDPSAVAKKLVDRTRANAV
jgi:hypothetical protein